jgi:hypothetical protein
MKRIILEGKHHVQALLGILLEYCDVRMDAMLDASEYVESLDKWQSLTPDEQAKESNWELIGTFTLAELIEGKEQDNERRLV